MGLLFLPYTGMVLSFSVIGAMLADFVHWDRVVATLIIYFLGLGIGAHALDAVGSKGLETLGESSLGAGLWVAALSSIAAAYVIAIYYMIFLSLSSGLLPFFGRFFGFCLQPGMVRR